MTISDAKAHARNLAFARRKEASLTEVTLDIPSVVKLCQHVKTVSVYLPIRTEIDSLPVMCALHDAGKTVCVPRILGEGVPLDFIEWMPNTEMITAEFGTYLPIGLNVVVPDVVLAPVVAFDTAGVRLGYGGGYYDRTLAKLRDQNLTPYYGLAYSAQAAISLPIDQYDIKLDGVITESGLKTF